MNKRTTYKDLAGQWGITVAAAKQRVRRYGWLRQTANDGSIIIVVPSDTQRLPQKTIQKRLDSGENELTKRALETIERLQERSDKRIGELTEALLAETAKSASLSRQLEKAEAALESYVRTHRRTPNNRSLLRLIGRIFQ